jgi:CRISPR/Cas system-associated protein Csm6
MLDLRVRNETAAPGRVTARSGSRHTVATDDGRTLLVESAVAYPPESRVMVLAGSIIGPAGAAPVIKNYQQ